MKKVCVITGTRAEYGLLYWTLKALKEDAEIALQLCVTGMHLSPEFGLTYQKIEEDGFTIDYKVESLLSADTGSSIGKSIGLGTIGFADAFQQLTPDLVLVLGDRFEILAAVIAAMAARIPVGHCHGGEATEGLIDESIRHSITKMSHLHFTATDTFSKRVIQLGEQPKNVFCVGALGIENINKISYRSKQDLEKIYDITFLEKNYLITFHSETLSKQSPQNQFNELLLALDNVKDDKTFFLFTKPNADNEGRELISMIDEYVKNNPKNAFAVTSLGQKNYLSALKIVDLVVGNSSSGLIEVPSFNIPTINIGERQRGRIKSKSIIDCDVNHESILSAIKKAFDNEFRLELKNIKNPYGNSNASHRILEVIKRTNLNSLLKKKFFNQ